LSKGPGGRDFYLRQLWDMKGSVDTAMLVTPEDLGRYGGICAWALARAHARSGDSVAISAYLGRSDAFDGAIADFSETYADVNAKDYAAYLEAIKMGRVSTMADATATKPYVLLRDALEKEKRMAVVTVSIRTRMTMAVLRVRDGVIVMQTMLWPDEIRGADFASVDEEQHATKQEMDMAKVLIDQLAGDFDPGDYEDDYAIAVKELVRAKVEGGEVQAPPVEEDEGGEVVDLLAALSRSVEKAKAARGEAPSTQEKNPPKKSASNWSIPSTNPPHFALVLPGVPSSGS